MNLFARSQEGLQKMLQPLLNCLTNLPVGRKLMLAFGMLSVLSLAAIGLAIQSAKSLLEGAQQSQTMADINLLLLQARSAEKSFALSHDEDSVQILGQRLDELEQRVEELRTGDSTSLDRLNDIRTSVQTYRNQFNQFVAGTQDALQTFEVMQKQADEARIQFEFVELDMYSSLREVMNSQGSLNPDTLTFAENASALLRQLLAIRTREFAFAQLGSDQALKEWTELMQGTEGDVSRLHDRIGHEHEDILQAAETALDNYRIAFQHYQTSRSSNEHAAEKMKQQAEQVLRQADQALSSHKQLMEQRASNILRLLSVSAIIIIGLALIAGIVIRQLIVPPLRQTLTLAQAIAAGDLSQNIVTQRSDELGQLCQAMGSMSSGLRHLIQRIVQSIDELHNAAGQLQQASLTSSEGARNQQRETEQAATATQQMAHSAEAVSRHAEQASHAARLANQHASTGEQVVRQSADQIGRLADDVALSMHMIRQLHEGSERIGGVLDVIKAVAEQTNLLALNAAIEAARAGEQGRGFAVVADEVRALARRTQDSTRQIETLIAELQGMSEQAVQQMAGSALLSQEAVAHGEQTRAALSRITDAVSSIESLNLQIATASEEQSSVAGEISENVERVRGIADQEAAATDDIARSSSELARLGGELQQLVRQFHT
nr:methyl-accepting chemotaxis protein [Pseudomonas citronellolis]